MTEAIFFFKSLTPLGWAVLAILAGAPSSSATRSRCCET